MTVYCGIGTVIGAKAMVQGKQRGTHDPGFGAALMGMFWPLGIWFLLAILLMQHELDKKEAAVTARERAVHERERAVHERKRILDAITRELEEL
jgi:hypothetical protein